MFKNIFKIISFILVCATAFTFVACTPTISSGDESGSDTNNGLIGGGTQAIFDEAIKKADPAYWAADGVHPTPAGHTLISEALQSFDLIEIVLPFSVNLIAFDTKLVKTCSKRFESPLI